jgi:hypothetical protein
MLGDIFEKGIEEIVMALTGQTIATNAATIETSFLAMIPKPFGFAGGGRPTGPSIVGENGPEWFVPYVAGTILPNGVLPSLAAAGPAIKNPFNVLPDFRPGFSSGARNPAPSSIGNSSSSQSHSISTGEVHLHGVQDAREMMRKIANYAKTASPKFSRFSK